MPSRFDHISANHYFDRDAVAQRWVPKLAGQAMDNMRDEEALLERWARIDCVPFWDALAKTMNAQLQRRSECDSSWNRVLLEAGEMGNRVVFQRAPSHSVEAYVQRNRLVHPNVGVWLVAQGFCTQDHLRAQVNEARFGLDNDGFAGCQRGEPMAPEFVAQWCRGMLGHYGLDVGQKARVVGQTMIAFGQKMWREHVEPNCAPYLGELDLDLLRSIFADATECRHDSLEESLRMASRNPQRPYEPDQAVAIIAKTPNIHQPLLALLNLAPPQNRLDLYFAAHGIRQMERGFRAESLELPQLV